MITNWQMYPAEHMTEAEIQAMIKADAKTKQETKESHGGNNIMTTTDTQTKAPRTLAAAGSIQYEFDKLIEQFTDSEGDLDVSPDDMEKFWGATDVAEQKLINLKRMKEDRQHRIDLINDEMMLKEMEVIKLTQHLVDRIEELKVARQSQLNKIEKYKWFIMSYLGIRGINKFDIGVTRAHITPSSKVIVGKNADLTTWAEDLVKVTRAPIKAALKKLPADQLPDDVTIETGQALTWK